MTEKGRLEVLTPDSPRWQTFVDELDQWLWDGCRGGTNKDHAIAIMRKMGGIDIEASVAFFEANGGYCDCEIILNVAWKYEPSVH
jgi:hypothetical protein